MIRLSVRNFQKQKRTKDMLGKTTSSYDSVFLKHVKKWIIVYDCSIRTFSSRYIEIVFFAHIYHNKFFRYIITIQ